MQLGGFETQPETSVATLPTFGNLVTPKATAPNHPYGVFSFDL